MICKITICETTTMQGHQWNCQFSSVSLSARWISLYIFQSCDLGKKMHSTPYMRWLTHNMQACHKQLAGSRAYQPIVIALQTSHVDLSHAGACWHLFTCIFLFSFLVPFFLSWRSHLLPFVSLLCVGRIMTKYRYARCRPHNGMFMCKFLEWQLAISKPSVCLACSNSSNLQPFCCFTLSFSHLPFPASFIVKKN